MKRVLIAVLLACIAVSCGKKEEEKKAPPEPSAERLRQELDLEEAIVGTPPEVVSTTATIDITFRDPVVPAHLVGTVLDKNPFVFDPKIEGHAEWLNRRVLRFVPEKRLPAGKRIKALLRGKIAFGERKKVGDFHFSFEVAEQEILSLRGDFVPVQGVKNGVVYVGTLSFAEPVEVKELERELELEGPRGKVGFTLRSVETRDRIEVSSDTLERKEKGQRFVFSLPARYTAVGKRWTQTVFLPGVGVFRVLSHMDMTEPGSEQPVYGLRFSDPIRSDMDLSGYVSVTPETDYRIRVKGKYLLIQGGFTRGKEYTLKVRKGFPSAFGTKLPDDYELEFLISNIKPQVEWLSTGIFLPTDNNYRLQFKSVNVARVKITVTEIYPQNIGFFLQENALVERPGPRMMRGPRWSRYRDLSRVGEEIFRGVADIKGGKNKWVKTELDLSPVFNGKEESVFVILLRFGQDDLVGRCTNSQEDLEEGDLYFQAGDPRENPCRRVYYIGKGGVSKLLVSSNIGLTVKDAEDGLHVFAVDVRKARPVSGLELSAFGYQNQLLETGRTDRSGYVFFKQKGAYILGSDDSGIALIRRRDSEWQLSGFDVAGSRAVSKSIDLFTYTDRGVYRPGDTVQLSAIVRIDRQVPPEKQPVFLRVRNPQGQVVHEAKASCGFNGHVHLPIATELSDPTGDWVAELKVGDRILTRPFKVEAVKPQRLKLDVDVPAEIHAPELLLKGTIRCKYLFGAPGAGLKAKVEVSFFGVPFSAEGFEGYVFSSPLRSFERRTRTAFEGNLDEKGVRHLEYVLPGLSSAPALVGANLKTTVYEIGGSSVTSTETTTIFPYTAFAGIKNVLGRGGVKVGEDYSIPIIVLDGKGNPAAGHRLKVKVYVNHEHWWWHYDRRDRKDFRKMKSTYLIGEYDYVSEKTTIHHSMKIEDSGRHLIEVEDLESGHETGIFFYASRWGRKPPTEEKERNYVKISTDKRVHSVGDRARISFDTPREGMALLTVEQGRRILRREWKPVEGPKTSFSIPITEEMIPNCYVSVSVIQPHGQKTNDVPMRLYGIETIYVEEEATHLQLSLSVPEKLKPKEHFKVTVTSRARRKATCTIAIVDEGLLGLTDFETPKPWAYFFRKIRLGIRTVDNLDEILGALFPDIDRYFSIGGGLAVRQERALLQRAERERLKRLGPIRGRRFEPVVLFKGPIAIDPGGTVEAEFTMPNYVGSVRVMVVGTAGNSYASLEKAVPVRQPLMILPTVPRVVRPGDDFAVPVSVFLTDSTERKVELSISTSDCLVPAAPRTIRIEFAEPGERDTAFFVRAGSCVGVEVITLSARAGELSSDYTVHLPVKSANPFYTEVTDTTLMKGERLTLIPKKFGIEGTNAARLAFSRMPDMQLDERLSYLIRYPYGCIEQTVSSAFPQLFLPYLADLKSYQKQEVTDNINAAIERLSRYQMGRGFSFWPIGAHQKGEYSDWGTSYAGHFLIEAREAGYYVPGALYKPWLKDAKRNAKKVNEKNHRYQAYRLFLLALAGEPDVGAMNLVREDHLERLDPLSKKLLGAAYYLSGKKDIAGEIDRSASAPALGYRELSGTYGSRLRDLAFMTYLCLKTDDLKTASVLLKDLSRSFSVRRWYSTQETAMALLSLGSYCKSSPFIGGSVKFEVKLGSGKTEQMTLSGARTELELKDMWGKEVRVLNSGPDPLFVTLFREGVPLESKIKTESNGIRLTRSFYGADGLPTEIDQREQGKGFWVVYTVENTYNTTLEEIALSSLFPAGWEIMNPRMAKGPAREWVRKLGLSRGKYMDIRDDRVNWFFDLSRSRAIRVGVRINPTFKGEYVLPPVTVEAMYSPEFYARIAGGEVSVK